MPPAMTPRRSRPSRRTTARCGPRTPLRCTATRPPGGRTDLAVLAPPRRATTCRRSLVPTRMTAPRRCWARRCPRSPGAAHPGAAVPVGRGDLGDRQTAAAVQVCGTDERFCLGDQFAAEHDLVRNISCAVQAAPAAKLAVGTGVVVGRSVAPPSWGAVAIGSVRAIA